VAVPTVTTFDALLSGYTWNGVGVSGQPTFLTYSFDTAAAASFDGVYPRAFLDTFRAFNNAEQALAREALGAWADATGLTLFEVPAGQGDIRFGAYDFNMAPAELRDDVGYALNPFVLAIPDGAWEEDTGGDVLVQVGQVSFGVLLHEIGHALGLKHPFEGEVVLDPALDDLAHTVMTYNTLGGPPGALGSLDVAAAQALYGTQAADGTQVASWSWDPARLMLVQAGDDAANRIAGVAVADVIAAGAGADYVMARAGADSIDGGDGADTLAGGDGGDSVDGGAGGDVIDGDRGDDLLRGGAGDDSVWGVAGLDTLDGGDGRDMLVASADGGRLLGGGGDDVLVIHGPGVVVDGGAGFDQLWLAAPTSSGAHLSYADLAAGGGSYAGIEAVALFGDAGPDTLDGGGLPDDLVGGDGADSLEGAEADDRLFGGAGADTLLGGVGRDTLSGGAGANYLRGEEGADSLVGGAEFDDINGNMGDDTAVGGGGDDWVVGGKDNDSLSGEAGADIVYGNLGADTCDGGAGDDIVRGGQQDDIVQGGDGDDFLSGDRGADTVSGGAGADLFHTFGEAGLDRVLDFHIPEGDRVMLDPGSEYTVVQVGADTVINLVGGGQMILAGVALTSLPAGWIFGA
jgi:Ca2+-binding RTX toxin-like protein